MNHRRNKYKVSPADARTWRGRTYASKAEMLYAKELDLQLRGGLIAEIVEQPIIHLGPIDYRPDFAVRRTPVGVWYWADVKGMETPEFRLKCKLWAECGPGTLYVVKLSGKRFKVARVIESKGAK